MKTTKIIILALLTLVAAQSAFARPQADQTERGFIIVDYYYPPRPVCFWWRWLWRMPHWP